MVVGGDHHLLLHVFTFFAHTGYPVLNRCSFSSQDLRTVSPTRADRPSVNTQSNCVMSVMNSMPRLQVQCAGETPQDTLNKSICEQGAAAESSKTQAESRSFVWEDSLQKNAKVGDEDRSKISDLEARLQSTARILADVQSKVSQLETGIQNKMDCIKGKLSNVSDFAIDFKNISAVLDAIQFKVSDLEQLQSRVHAIENCASKVSHLEAELQQNTAVVNYVQSKLSSMEEDFQKQVSPLEGLKPKVLILEEDVQKTLHSTELIQTKMTEFSYQMGKLDRVIEEVSQSHIRYDILALMKLIQTTQHDVTKLAEEVAADRGTRKAMPLSASALPKRNGIGDSKHGINAAEVSLLKLEGLLDRFRERTLACADPQSSALGTRGEHDWMESSGEGLSRDHHSSASEMCASCPCALEAEPDLAFGHFGEHNDEKQLATVDCMQSPI